MRSESDILKEIDRIFEKLANEKNDRNIQYYLGWLKAFKWVIK